MRTPNLSKKKLYMEEEHSEAEAAENLYEIIHYKCI